MAIRRALSDHPRWSAAAALAVVLLGGAFWYLASPLWIRTYAEEALPVVPVATAIATASGARGGDVVPQTVAPAQPKILLKGQLGHVDQIHNGKGEVRIVELGAQRLLRFEDVVITNAPDVHVYLSRETGGKWAERTSLYLGALKATNGSFNYEIPAGTDLAPYKSVVIWCRAFGVLVTWADLG